MKHIIISGPESAGKSSLTNYLGEKFKVPTVPEYARWYLECIERPYHQLDLYAIAKGQQSSFFRIRDKNLQSSHIIIDTWAFVLYVWHKIRFNCVPEYVFQYLERIEIDMVLLCKPDLPWIEDPLREHPGRRDELFEIYFNLLKSYSVPFHVIKGNNSARYKSAENAILDL